MNDTTRPDFLRRMIEHQQAFGAMDLTPELVAEITAYIEAERARASRLAGALKPFVAVRKAMGGNHVRNEIYGFNDAVITVADLDRAVAALDDGGGA